MSGQYSYGPPPLAEALPQSPRRRYPAGQAPSLLTTTLGNVHLSGHGYSASIQTPSSATTLSSPFAHPASPGGALRGTSPMALRTPAGFSGAYNPQQWGPVGNRSPGSARPTASSSRRPSQTSRLAPRPLGPDEPVASPPPPYSPRRKDTSDSIQRNSREVASPADTVSPATDPSRYSTPVSAATTISPDFAPSSYRRSPLPPSQPFIAESPILAQESDRPPPPPAVDASNRARSSSRPHTDRLLYSLTSRNRSATTVTPVAAIATLQQNTAQALINTANVSQADTAAKPPAARRAASTGVIGMNGSTSRSASRSPPHSGWEPGMPLPPPPPGPPPRSSARSQSLNRNTPGPDVPTTQLPRSQRVLGLGSTLGPVPPTPADWKEEDRPSFQQSLTSRSQGLSQLHIDTGSVLRRGHLATDEGFSAMASSPLQTRSSQGRRDSSMAALARSPAVRNRSAKGIRERRSESRSGRIGVTDPDGDEGLGNSSSWISSQEDVRPTDLVLPGNGTISRRRTNTRTPRSGKSVGSLDGAISTIDQRLGSQESSHSTPRPESARSPPQSSNLSATSIARPDDGSASGSSSLSPNPLANPSTPQQGIGSKYLNAPTVRNRSEERPVSHILHIPNVDDVIQAPLLPLSSPRAVAPIDLLGPESPAAFSQRALERHRRFAEQEAAAANDSERLDLFVRYMLAESRIRREQYSAVFEDEDIDVEELTRGYFADSRKVGQSETSEGLQPTKKNKKIGSMHASTASESSVHDSIWQGDSTVSSRKHESPITASSDNSPQIRPESSWWNDYVPCLSPIASMSIVTGQDEMDSRGRAPSRWFEDPSGTSAQGDAFSVFGRSKRESKYMGLPKEARNSPALFETAPSSTAHGQSQQNHDSGHPALNGEHEYPPEKTGWHEENTVLSSPPPSLHPTPYTPNSRKLDISRLVTLPPPYPRHHPAVNNSHPDLAVERAVVRSLQDCSEPNTIRESFEARIAEKRHRAEAWCKHQQSLHEQDVQFRIEHCEISPGGFDQAESEIERKILQSERDVVQEEFDLFQSMVVFPLHTLFSERINEATSSLDKTSGRLFSDAQQHSPNLPQEEGDDHAELLEKLTQLKWLFEARENLHRETYNLLSERNEKYKTIICLPYRQTKNPEKLLEAESFFAKDAHDRQLAFDQAVATRSQAFLAVVENNVTRGVEIQLSAFWDIAPSILQIIHRIPHGLQHFEIQIPADEYTENPSYHEHPMQYLYSLLTHAEKSTHQFIESQTNLLCLLHEIRSLALAMRFRAEESSMDEGEEWAERMQLEREREERALMDDLKEKVAVVEGQWVEGLGSRIGGERERMREYLEGVGGWDEEAEMA